METSTTDNTSRGSLTDMGSIAGRMAMSMWDFLQRDLGKEKES